METFPNPIPEQPRSSGNAGEKSTSSEKKSKKKTTRIPKKLITATPLEQPSAGPESEAPEKPARKQPKKTVFSPVLPPIETEQASEAPKESTDTGAKSEASHRDLPEVEAPVVAAGVPDNSEKEPKTEEIKANQDEEPVIFSRQEAPESIAETEAVIQTGEDFAAPVEPARASGGHNQEATGGFEPFPTLEAIENTDSAPDDAPEATPVNLPNQPEIDLPAVDAPVFYEDLASKEPPMAERQQMVDPSQRYHVETLQPDVTKKELDEAYYKGQKTGTRKGVGAGLVAGWWAGRRSGKRQAEKSANKALEKRDKEIKKLTENQVVVAERLRTMEASKEQLPHQPEQAKPAAERAFFAEAPTVAPPISVLAAEHLKPSSFERPKPMPAEAPVAKKPEQAPEDKPITEETYQAPAGRRVEMSAWHRVEVDEKTGKAVENPEVAYGREFAHEQQQEKLHREAAERQAAVQLGHAVMQADDSTTQAQPTPSAKQASPSVADQIKKTVTNLKQDTPYIKRELRRRTLDPVTWVVALLLVVVLFATGVF